LFSAGFCCASKLAIAVRIGRAQPQLPLYWKPADSEQALVSIPT
jgi:hypothetical protein